MKSLHLLLTVDIQCNHRAITRCGRLAVSRRNYYQLNIILGFTRQREYPGRAVYFGTEDDVQLVVITPADGRPATAGNGTMVALNVDSQEQVQRLHARAIDLGASDEGAPGPRGSDTFYGAYFRDPDGNKIAFYLR
jgi:catechol 2,3-dioxygenase-like lactoylglutathione lyase family enzyme